FSLEDLLLCYGPVPAEWTPGPALPFCGVAIDSRRCQPGELFFALPGEHRDGHDFIEEALAKGCPAVVARADRFPVERCMQLGLEAYSWQGTSWQRTGPEHARGAVVRVSNTLEALQRLAARHRERFHPVVIGVTGSVGKSTTKEAIAAVLSRGFRTLKSVASYNNEIGLPLTMLSLRPEHEVVVLEMGTYGPGEIRLLAQIARPHIGVVTNVSHSHLERMGTLERIAQAKAELPASLPPDGLALLNGDEPLVRGMAEVTRAPVQYFGVRADCHIRATEVRSLGLEGIEFGVQADGEERFLRCSLVGRHSIYSALPAVALGRRLGLAWEAIEAGLLDPAARLRLLPSAGPRGSLLLDDTYNASPFSCRAALELLAELPGRHIAVLGDMLELGSYEEEGHREVGRLAAGVVELLVVLGARSRWIAEEAMAYGLDRERVYEARDHEDAACWLLEQLQPGDVVLVKGSRAMEMERVIAALGGR
ncbi:MAG: UDP-N-acetylmuramoyl-tripeptide--D-alanyl-D-alanine ligase, partial [Chloroflexia bacterium]